MANSPKILANIEIQWHGFAIDGQFWDKMNLNYCTYVKEIDGSGH